MLAQMRVTDHHKAMLVLEMLVSLKQIDMPAPLLQKLVS